MDEAARAVVFCDLDGTLYTGHIWQALKRYYQARRMKLPTLYFYLYTHMAIGLLYRLHVCSEEYFFRVWAIHMAWLFSGLTPPQAQQVFDAVVEEDVLPQLRADVLARLHEHQAQGEPVILLSGTFQPLLATIAARLGLDGALGTELALRDGRYTGRIVPSLCFAEGKVSRLEAYRRAHPEVDPAACTAYGDTHFDRLALEWAGRPVAVYPNPRLAALAAERGWPIVGSPQQSD